MSEISKKLRIPHQTVSDWIHNKRRSGERRELFKKTERFDRLDEPAFDGRCPDCGGQMRKNAVRKNPLSDRGVNQIVRWGCRCGLSVKTQGDKVVSAWLGG
ncbi:hypothetical protein ES706_03732 [subsurface metagenome]